ncbi:hypothetical protein KC326_g214 [Hortaea werneckii]|nr:hypothetical protein KC326_g214 [Hortaea werneckii]
MCFLISSKLEKKIIFRRQLLTTETARPTFQVSKCRVPATSADLKEKLVFITGQDTYTGPTYDAAQAAGKHNSIGRRRVVK